MTFFFPSWKAFDIFFLFSSRSQEPVYSRVLFSSFQELLVHSTLKLETSANDDGVALFLCPDFSFSI